MSMLRLGIYNQTPSPNPETSKLAALKEGRKTPKHAFILPCLHIPEIVFPQVRNKFNCPILSILNVVSIKLLKRKIYSFLDIHSYVLCLITKKASVSFFTCPLIFRLSPLPTPLPLPFASSACSLRTCFPSESLTFFYYPKGCSGLVFLFPEYHEEDQIKQKAGVVMLEEHSCNNLLAPGRKFY